MICLVSNHKRLGYKCKHVIFFLRSLGLYLYIAAKYDMSFSLEQGRGTRRWTTSALGLWRNRVRFVNLHACIFATGSARVRHRRRRNTACRSAAKAVCGNNVPMILGTWIIRISKSSRLHELAAERHALFTRTVADRPGIRTVSQPLHSVLFTVGSLMGAGVRQHISP